MMLPVSAYTGAICSACANMCSESARLYGSGWKMLPFQNADQEIAPVRSRGACSAPQARIHMLSSESPRSPGTSRPRPSTSGHVKTSASAV